MLTHYLDLQRPNLLFIVTTQTDLHTTERQSITAKKAEFVAQLAARKVKIAMKETIAAQWQELKKLENKGS